jgi:uncharacterized protein YcnI
MRSLGWHALVMSLAFGSLTALATTTANAHVRVVPSESKTGATETYKVTVPTEGKVSTVDTGQHSRHWQTQVVHWKAK